MKDDGGPSPGGACMVPIGGLDLAGGGSTYLVVSVDVGVVTADQSDAGSDISVSKTFGHSPVELAVEHQDEGDQYCASTGGTGDAEDSDMIRAPEAIRRWIPDLGCGTDLTIL